VAKQAEGQQPRAAKKVSEIQRREHASATRAREGFMQSRENWTEQRVPRRPMVIKRRRELRRQGQFGCPQCQVAHPLADACKGCGRCPKCCACKGPVDPTLQPSG